MRVLLTNPENDNITFYLRVWTDDILKKCKNVKNKYFRLKREKVSRKNVENMLKKRGVDLVLFCGHGESDKIYGRENEVIVDATNVGLLKDKNVYSFSCMSAKKLGKVATKYGAKSYIGYDEDFVMFSDDTARKPFDDEIATLFLKPAFAVTKALLKGKTSEEAVDTAKKEFDKSIARAINSDIQSDADSFVNWLYWDRDHLVCRD